MSNLFFGYVGKRIRAISSIQEYISHLKHWGEYLYYLCVCVCVRACVCVMCTLCLSWHYTVYYFPFFPMMSIVQNFSDCLSVLILKKRRTVFKFLHWLPVQQRIQYKINTLCYKCITGTALSYLSDCLQLYTPSRTHYSASDTHNLQIPCTRLSTVGSHAFSVFVCLHEWPSSSSLDSFKCNLKTFLFPKL